ncbi:hypothetical protein ABEG18_16265 [Alsobacter sp. KACC 23698]|uniref:Flagellin N-terminal domain-containing protein n=1 Tax=Alsobacter sp. KACC 23698 TaxID=3149229 RepID=A0AAU7JAA1_9HYPH
MVAISAQMASSLNNLLSLNDDITRTQSRLSTGKAIASASDSISVFFKAKSFTDKGEQLDNVNKNVSQAVANLDIVDKALSNMQENIKGAQQLMRDARAKATTPSNAANTFRTNGTSTGTSYAVTAGAPTATPPVPAIRGSIVDTSAASDNGDNSSMFQVGDIIQVNVLDTKTNTTLTRYLKAVAPSIAGPNQTKNGAGSGVAVSPAGALTYTAANDTAIEFSDLATLASGLTTAFGVANANFQYKETTSAATPPVTTGKIGFSLAGPNLSLTFGQVFDANLSATTAATTNALADFGSIFGKNFAANAGPTALGASPSIGSAIQFGSANPAASYTYASSAGPGNDPITIEARKNASDFFKQTMVGLDAMVKDAYLPGFGNVLRGDTLKVDLNETGLLQQQVKLASAIDFTQTFGTANTWGVGFNATNQTTGFTGDDFLTDGLLDNALTAVSKIYTGLKAAQVVLAAAKTSMSSRLDYNKVMVSSLTTTANEMTAADTATEASKLAALQNQQSFATTNMSITKQAEQSLLQLLR